MQTTTVSAILSHFENLLRELEPSHEAHRDHRWARIVDAQDVSEADSPELRRYVFLPFESRLTREAFSYGEVYTFRLEVHAACGGLTPDQLYLLVDDDHLDLRQLLENELEPGTDGFGGIFKIDDLGYEMDSTLVNGAVAHIFDVLYFRNTGLN
jgi:hypothetical protein